MSEGTVAVDVLTPSFVYPAKLSYQELIKKCREELDLTDREKVQLCSLTVLEKDGGTGEPSEEENKERLAFLIERNNWSLEFIAYTFEENKRLSEKLEKSADALVTLHQQMLQDKEAIRELKKENRALKKKHKKIMKTLKGA
eukprot:TRINITY_DN2708_c0_g2_i1.p1 TRINITY_DN2708_c0_g2~~TRINITY_DN2708_c0_g2_i1.p1  ORF type:complete len:142 (-),score=39.81 TRINITY_DN2708_c0_g2_i1:121-546(-)